MFILTKFVYIACFVCFLFFFFQAEDGIRDRDVTGVQTCALPISPRSRVLPSGAASVRTKSCSSARASTPAGSAGASSPGPESAAGTPTGPSSRWRRSEERRVGKECGTGRRAGTVKQRGDGEEARE